MLVRRTVGAPNLATLASAVPGGVIGGAHLPPEASLLATLVGGGDVVAVVRGVAVLTLAHAHGLQAAPVCFPGRFLVGGREDFLDCYDFTTRLRDWPGWSDLLERLYPGGEVALNPEAFDPVADARVEWRILNNLRAAYAEAGDWPHAAAAASEMLALRPEEPALYRERSGYRYQVGDVLGSAFDSGSAEALTRSLLCASRGRVSLGGS